VGFNWIPSSLFNHISKLKEVPEIFKGTPFQKVIEMSRISELPKEVKEDWKKELDENRYVQEGIRFEIQDAVEEAVEAAVKEAEAAVKEAEAAVKEASEKSFNEGYQEGVGIGEELGIKKGTISPDYA
jgi:flagellar biosynthesis/type III secretory pathway protein FliH